MMGALISGFDRLIMAMDWKEQEMSLNRETTRTRLKNPFPFGELLPKQIPALSPIPTADLYEQVNIFYGKIFEFSNAAWNREECQFSILEKYPVMFFSIFTL